MAKLDTVAWWSEVAKQAGLPEDKVKAALEILQDEKVSNVLGEQVMMRSDYSRNMDSLKRDRETMETKNREYYENELKRTKANEEAVTRANSIVQEYVSTYGELPNAQAVREGTPGARAALDASKFISKEEHEKAMATLGNQFVTVLENGLTSVADYQERFGKALPVAELKKYAIENNLPLDQAYKNFIQPKVEELNAKSWEEKLKAAKEEGAREALSRVKQPLDNAPRGTSPFRESLEATLKADKSAARPTERDLREGFSNAWREANAPKS